jgi:hypothetical protein
LPNATDQARNRSRSAVGTPQHLGNDGHREWDAEILDEVNAASGIFCAVQQFRYHPGDLRPERFHAARRECLREEVSQARMVWRIEKEHLASQRPLYRIGCVPFLVRQPPFG